MSGSVLTARSLEPASDSVSVSLSPCPSPVCALFLSLKNKQTLKKFIDKKLFYSSWGAWVAQLVKCLTLDFSSGHDLMVWEFERWALR